MKLGFQTPESATLLPLRVLASAAHILKIASSLSCTPSFSGVLVETRDFDHSSREGSPLTSRPPGRPAGAGGGGEGRGEDTAGRVGEPVHSL